MTIQGSGLMRIEDLYKFPLKLQYTVDLSKTLTINYSDSVQAVDLDPFKTFHQTMLLRLDLKKLV